MKFSKKNIAIAIILFLGIAQFFKIDKTNPALNSEMDFIKIKKAPAEIANMIKSSCYNCHSNETIYPWYTDVAPISWWVKGHINGARAYLNFSEWGSYDMEKKKLRMEKAVKAVYEIKSMPLLSYTLLHPEAKLTTAQRKKLADWFAQQK